MKYFEVIAKCGHVGRNHYYEGHFFIKAHNAKNASKYVKTKPRVKRDHEDAILSVSEVTYKEYLDGVESMKNNPYFNCCSKYEQEEKWEEIKENVYEETETQITYRKMYRKDYRQKRSEYTNIYIDGQRMRNPYKYYKMNNYYENGLVGA